MDKETKAPLRTNSKSLALYDGSKPLDKSTETFIFNYINGDSIINSYQKAFCNNPNKQYTNHELNYKPYEFLHGEKIQKRITYLKNIIQSELVSKSIWTKEQSIETLKNLLYDSIEEKNRYTVSYNMEYDLIQEKIKDIQSQLNDGKPKSKRYVETLKENLQEQKENIILLNKRHYANKTINETILNTVNSLNILLGYNEVKETNNNNLITFIDNLTSDKTIVQ